MRAWLPRGDGTYLRPQAAGLVAFDPVAMTLTVENPSVQVLGTGIDFKGRGLVVILNADGTRTIHLATRGLPVAIPVPESVWTFGGSGNPNSIRLISTPDLTDLVLTWPVNSGAGGMSPPHVFRLPPVP